MTNRSEAHMDDALLIQHMDGALGAGDRRRAERHLEACIGCGDRMRVLKEQRARLRAALAGTSAPLPDAWLDPARRALGRGRVRAVERLALSAAALVLAALLVPPAYAFIAQRLAGPPPAVEVAPAADPPAPAPPPVPAATSPAAIRFVPAGSVLTVSFAAPESGGVLHVRPTAGPQAAFEPGAIAGTERPVLLLPAALDVRNEGGGAPRSYVLWTPPSVTAVRVVVGGRLADSLAAGGADRFTRLDR